MEKVEVFNQFGRLLLTLEADKDGQVLLAHWQGHFNIENVRAGFEKIEEAIKKHKFNKLLLNNKNVMGYQIEVNPWIKENFFQSAAQIGLKQVAAFSSDNISVEFGSRDLAQVSSNTLNYKHFYSLREAENWLRTFK
ncbi:MAG: hypothetical protein EAZ55_11235 [Cytophagales bacterium]|nr:MAG: hypothetical protein EAZ55_11235 [Cytophagales bacterium]